MTQEKPDPDEAGPQRAVRRHRTVAHIPGLTPGNAKRAQERERSTTARNRLSGQLAKMQKDREAQEAQDSQEAKGGTGR